ncbi:hypothetical protein GTQ40_00780 [Flavobacteriaceae bacterium R38]|nr:hypothetical protein [Flavobacteriaceae bacterium R38]
MESHEVIKHSYPGRYLHVDNSLAFVNDKALALEKYSKPFQKELGIEKIMELPI